MTIAEDAIQATNQMFSAIIKGKCSFNWLERSRMYAGFIALGIVGVVCLIGVLCAITDLLARLVAYKKLLIAEAAESRDASITGGLEEGEMLTADHGLQGRNAEAHGDQNQADGFEEVETPGSWTPENMSAVVRRVDPDKRHA